MNTQTKKVLHAGAAGMALSVRGKGGAHNPRKTTTHDDGEVEEGLDEYEERKRKAASYYSFRPTRYPLPPL